MEVNYRHYILFPDGTYKKSDYIDEICYELMNLDSFDGVIVLDNVPTYCENSAEAFAKVKGVVIAGDNY